MTIPTGKYNPNSISNTNPKTSCEKLLSMEELIVHAGECHVGNCGVSPTVIPSA